MNFFESEVLKGKYFPDKNRKRLRVVMVNLFIFVGVFVILLYAYENLVQGYHIMAAVDMFMVFTLVVAYLLFPYYVGINTISYMVLGALTFLLAVSFVIPDKDPELSLFWLATLPIFVFFFLGVNKGIRWSINMFLVLLFIPLFSFITGIKFVYDWELLSQIILGYLVVSYMLYIIESERSSYEKRLSVAREENQMLFKEVHHRTKNNMQIIMGLLETQSFKIDDPKYRKIFEHHVDRLKAMSLMHKNLYVHHTYNEVDIAVYLNEIAKSLQLYTQHKIITNIDAMMIDMKVAMNIGLIFNEAVTNAIEHAFSEDETGEINIAFRHIGERCVFIIHDNGKGFEESKEYNSLGLTLIQDLVGTLANSTLVIKNCEGTLIKIYFNLEEPV
ncbi:Sensory transduction histidine kinase [hydrothermal vent metagenome]|uniref:histidine kinase n=1 Tax=hydrothermal vent metagenome TaxID=652676 RepID=A0A1W1CY22_9ZZZZ